MTYKLNKQTAYEDYEKYIRRISQLCLDFLQDITIPQYQKEFSWQEIEAMSPNEVISRLLFGFNLAQIKGRYGSDIAPDLFKNLPCINLEEVLKEVFEGAYQYAAGGNDIDSNAKDAFRRLTYVYTKLSAAQGGSIHVQKRGRMVEDTVLEQVSPRYAYAVSLFFARSNFTTSMQFARIAPDPSTVCTTPRVLFTLAGVTNGYIMQLIREEKLPAEKKHGVWNIQVLPAFEWLQQRKDCPNWIGQL